MSSSFDEHEHAFARALLNLMQGHAGTTPGALPRRLVAHCLALLPVDSAGVLLVAPAALKGRGRSGTGRAIEVAASSHETLRRVEVYEIGTAQGPCIEALRTGRPHHVTDFTAHRSRWPGLALRATAAGYRAMWAEPLCHRGHAVGVINLYRHATGALDQRDQRRARTLARAATTGLLQRTLDDRPLRNGQLQQVLSTRIAIEQAKGILAGRLALSPDAAFEVLRIHARTQRMRLHDLARVLVDDPTGTWPPPNGQRP
ncbi:GAF and ANTAR domain-containing protein [Streptomyces violens]|uniref:GAF and ANTAR domain-containing protein n=1 Tax=Streptomyces violens TaxID=66377 RepID=UPI0006895AE9|nr:GAF and ANTAR domain-containing protein [Streptomyces violens]